MTAGGQSGMATTTTRTMGTVMLVAAQVDIHAGVQIMTPISEWYWNSSTYLLQCGCTMQHSQELLCYWMYLSVDTKYIITSLHKTHCIQNTSSVSWLLSFGMCSLVDMFQHFWVTWCILSIWMVYHTIEGLVTTVSTVNLTIRTGYPKSRFTEICWCSRKALLYFQPSTSKCCKPQLTATRASVTIVLPTVANKKLNASENNHGWVFRGHGKATSRVGLYTSIIYLHELKMTVILCYVFCSIYQCFVLNVKLVQLLLSYCCGARP